MSDTDGPLAFESFYRHHHGHVLRIVYPLCGSWSAAEDIAQEAFVKALHRWPAVAAMDRPDAWIRRVACNLATSRMRRWTIEAGALMRVHARASVPPVEDLPEDLDRFWRLVRGLPARQAHAIALFYADDLPVTEIAHVMGCAEGTVKAHLFAARRRLMEMYTLEEDAL